MNAMIYKGYSARMEFDEQDRIFAGHLAGIRDIVGFQGSSVNELEAAFQEAVDDYLAHCAQLNLPANKPFSGPRNKKGLFFIKTGLFQVLNDATAQ